MTDIPALPEVLIIACGALAPDLVRLKKLNGWSNIELQCLPAELHNTPQLITARIRKKIAENRDRFATIFIGYADCGTGGMLDRLIEQEGVERLPGAHCYEMFCGAEAFARLHEEEIGTFYLTDFLASHFDRLIVRGFGLDRYPEVKKQFFAHYKKLVYLAQTDNAVLAGKAHAAAEYLGLEYERVFTGDTHMQSVLARALPVTVRDAAH